MAVDLRYSGLCSNGVVLRWIALQWFYNGLYRGDLLCSGVAMDCIAMDSFIISVGDAIDHQD